MLINLAGQVVARCAGPGLPAAATDPTNTDYPRMAW
jgi:hypothetical protein